MFLEAATVVARFLEAADGPRRTTDLAAGDGPGMELWWRATSMALGAGALGRATPTALEAGAPEPDRTPTMWCGGRAGPW